MTLIYELTILFIINAFDIYFFTNKKKKQITKTSAKYNLKF